MYKELHAEMIMRKWNYEQNIGNTIKVSQPGLGGRDDFILVCELDVYVTTGINFQDASFTERCKAA